MLSKIVKMRLLRVMLVGYIVGSVLYLGHRYSGSTGNKEERSTATRSNLTADIDKIYVNLFKYVASVVKTGKPLVETDQFGELERVRSNYLGDNHGKVLSPFQDDYFQSMNLIPSVKTVYLNIKQRDLNVFLPDKFYSPQSNVCEMMTAGILSSDDGTLDCINAPQYNYWSMKNIPDSEGIPHINYTQGLFKPLVHVYVENASNVPYQSNAEDEVVTPWYIHIIKDAIITRRGEIYTSDKMWKIIPFVKDNSSLTFHLPSEVDPTIYSEVYVLTQYSKGNPTYNWLIESLPRIMRALRFLQEHSTIFIHVPSKTVQILDLLKDLGIAQNRIVSGTIRVKVTYLPTSTHHGRGNVVNTNLLSAYIRTLMSSSVEQNTIIYLYQPWMKHRKQILKMLRTVAREYSLNLELLVDDSDHSVKALMDMFQRAALVVGAHGEGFSNLVFSQPGTCVVEVLCYVKQEKRYHLRYQHLSFLLGHMYNGPLSPYAECIDMEDNVLEYYVRQCLHHRKQLKGTN